jgi:hypothetical protein
VLTRIFGALVFALAAWAGLRRRGEPRVRRAALWLSLLGLGSLASPGAWGDYVPVTAVLLLTVIAAPLTSSRAGRWFFAAAMLWSFFTLGTMPLGSWAPTVVMVPVSAAGALIMLGLFVGASVAPVAMRRRRAAASSTSPALAS